MPSCSSTCLICLNFSRHFEMETCTCGWEPDNGLYLSFPKHNNAAIWCGGGLPNTSTVYHFISFQGLSYSELIQNSLKTLLLCNSVMCCLSIMDVNDVNIVNTSKFPEIPPEFCWDCELFWHSHIHHDWDSHTMGTGMPGKYSKQKIEASLES